MRLSNVNCCFAFTFLLIFLLPTGSDGLQDVGLVRRKRFLSPDAFASIPESIMRISDRALEFTSKTLDGILDETNRGSSMIRRRLSPFESIFGSDSTPKQTKVRPPKNTEREVEGPEDGEDIKEESEVIVEEPHKVEEGDKDDEVSVFNPFSIPLSFTFGLFTPWWRGPNVCVERNEVDEPEKVGNFSFNINFESTQCIPTEHTYVCTKRIQTNGMKRSIIIKYQCCHGFIRRNDGKPGCREVKMDNLMKTLRSLEASKFADMLESTSLSDKLESENFTIFAPLDEDVVAFEEETEDNEILEAIPAAKRVKDLSYLVGGHIVEGFVNLHTAENDHLIPSLNGKTAIRINKYSPYNAVYTANCVPVNEKNNFATNGLVHVVSDVLPLPRKTVADVIAGGTQFSIFYNLLKETELMDELKDNKKSWTIFAPTDSAFKSVNKDLLQRLLAGEGCAESILRQHIVKGTVCSAAVNGRARVYNVLGKALTLTTDESKKLRVDDVAVNVTNIMGTNGVVHFISDVLIPSEAHSLMEILEKAERKDLLELIKKAELESTLNSLQNVTMFVPSRDAVKNVPEETLNMWKEKPEKLREVLLYHITSPKTVSKEFQHNKELATLADDQNIRMQLHEMFPGIAMGATAQCSHVVNHDNPACGAVLHLVDKMLVPPKKSIMEALRSLGGHETLLKLLASTDLEAKLANEEEGPYTLLAPNDEAFERFEKKTLDELLENKTRAEQILRMHVLPEAFCCSGVNHAFPFRHHYVRTMEGNLLSLHRSGQLDRVRFGPAKAMHCDVAARNGLVHSVNRVILPSRRHVPSIFDMDIFRLF